MPFVGAAIIAGYGAQQFKKKLDELADTLFDAKKSSKKDKSSNKDSSS